MSNYISKTIMLTIIDVKLFYMAIKNVEEIRYKMLQIILKYNN